MLTVSQSGSQRVSGSGVKENNKTRCGVPKRKTSEKYESATKNVESKTAIEQKATQKG